MSHSNGYESKIAYLVQYIEAIFLPYGPVIGLDVPGADVRVARLMKVPPHGLSRGRLQECQLHRALPKTLTLSKQATMSNLVFVAVSYILASLEVWNGVRNHRPQHYLGVKSFTTGSCNGMQTDSAQSITSR